MPDSVPLVGMTGAGHVYGRGGTGGGRAVAIVDSGVLSTHEFLAGKVVSEACFSSTMGDANVVSLCPNGTTSQTGAGAADPLYAQCISGSTQLCFHGTMTAGIAAGNNGNITWGATGKPPAGVGKGAQIVAVKVFHRNNIDAYCGGTGTSPCVRYFDSDLVSALNWIAQNAVNLPNGIRLAAVNMSLGNGVPQSTNCDTHVLKTPIDNLRALDVVTVIAAGNDNSVTGVSQPGCISTAFTVAASTKADAISSFSNMGPASRSHRPGRGSVGDHA